MHRVYNSAFMHMLRDEDNAGYRRLMKETLEFDREILKRYVNFMNNPDEKTAVEQFGKGDKYFGVATLLATLPGLPMLGHGQIEGFGEKYGMEFRRATLDERADTWLVERHEREIFPLLHRRGWFAGADDFVLYDFATDAGSVDENVFAYSNGHGPTRSLVVYHNRFGSTSGRIRDSVAFSVKGPDGDRTTERRSLAKALGLGDLHDEGLLAFRDAAHGLEYVRTAAELSDGLWLHLDAYARHLFWEFREVADVSGVWRRLHERLGGRGVPSLEDALREQELEPVHAALRAALAPGAPPDAVRWFVRAVGEATGTADGPADDVVETVLARWRRIEQPPAFVGVADRGAEVARERAPILRAWALLEPLGRLAPGAMTGPTSRAWFDELRLAPVIAGALRQHGLDEGAAWAGVERVRLLLTLPRPTNVRGRSAADRTARVVRAWLDDPELRAFLGVNRWQDVEWLDGDAWVELAGWAEHLDSLDGPGRSTRATTAAASAAPASDLATAAKRGGYRVAALRDLGTSQRAPAVSPPRTRSRLGRRSKPS
jgi:hypothetical protein